MVIPNLNPRSTFYSHSRTFTTLSCAVTQRAQEVTYPTASYHFLAPPPPSPARTSTLPLQQQCSNKGHSSSQPLLLTLKAFDSSSSASSPSSGAPHSFCSSSDLHQAAETHAELLHHMHLKKCSATPELKPQLFRNCMLQLDPP